jgi:hypothetical protein
MPSAIQQVIEKALSKNVQQRYGSALELRQAFEQARQVVGSRGVHRPNPNFPISWGATYTKAFYRADNRADQVTIHISAKTTLLFPEISHRFSLLHVLGAALICWDDLENSAASGY